MLGLSGFDASLSHLLVAASLLGEPTAGCPAAAGPSFDDVPVAPRLLQFGRRVLPAVVWIYEEQICHGLCTDTAQAATRTGEHEARARITLEHRVAVEMRDASLSEVASLIGRIADARIYVLADRLEERRTLRLQDVSLAGVVRELDLMAVDWPAP
jgi:hypothetical protein